MSEGKGAARLLSRLCVPAALLFLASRLFMLETLRWESLYDKLFMAVGFLAFGVTTCLAIVILIIQLFRRRPIEPGPLLFALAIGLIIQFAPLNDIMIDYDFLTRLPERTRFVEDVLSKKLQLVNVPPGDDAFLVPQQFKAVSNREIILMQSGAKGPILFFFLDSWILDNFSGFMYRSDDSEPQDKDFYAKIRSYSRLAPHWFFVCFI